MGRHRSCRTKAMCVRMSAPATCAVPAVGLYRPVSRWIRVDFPAPLGPQQAQDDVGLDAKGHAAQGRVDLSAVAVEQAVDDQGGRCGVVHGLHMIALGVDIGVGALEEVVLGGGGVGEGGAELGLGGSRLRLDVLKRRSEFGEVPRLLNTVLGRNDGVDVAVLENRWGKKKTSKGVSLLFRWFRISR